MRVGEFEVAMGGGTWVAVRGCCVSVSNDLLDGDSQRIAQELGGEVRSVWPNNRVQLGM